MIRAALVSALMTHTPQVDGTRKKIADLVLAGGPTTHDDGSVTWNPPKRYDKPFDGKETLRLMPQKEVVEACRKLFKKAGLDIKVTPKQLGCAVYKGKNGTIIAIDKPVGGVTPEAVIRHERGHLNGWDQHHSD
jgi:hypothetical protein